MTNVVRCMCNSRMCWWNPLEWATQTRIGRWRPQGTQPAAVRRGNPLIHQALRGQTAREHRRATIVVQQLPAWTCRPRRSNPFQEATPRCTGAPAVLLHLLRRTLQGVVPQTAILEAELLTRVICFRMDWPHPRTMIWTRRQPRRRHRSSRWTRLLRDQSRTAERRRKAPQSPHKAGSRAQNTVMAV